MLKFQCENKCFYSLKNLLKPSVIVKVSKIKSVKTILHLVVTYGAETWPIRKNDDINVLILKEKYFERILDR